MVLTNPLKIPFILGRCFKRPLPMNITTGGVLQLQRSMGRCAHLTVRCGDHFKEKPCDPTQQHPILPQPAPKPLPPQKRSIRLKHPAICCGNPCYEAYPRFDALYYKRTDKLCRVYQQTWPECPELIRKPKVICCFDKIKYPPFVKRPLHHRPETACTPLCLTTVSKCSRIDNPNCRKVRVPPKCGVYRGLSKTCKKIKAPFPSYSECRKKPTPELHPAECGCLSKSSICEGWRAYYRLARIRQIGVC